MPMQMCVRRRGEKRRPKIGLRARVCVRYKKAGTGRSRRTRSASHLNCKMRDARPGLRFCNFNETTVRRAANHRFISGFRDESRIFRRMLGAADLIYCLAPVFSRRGSLT